MSLNILPHTALASSVVSNTWIYTYLQTYHGELFEIKGKLSGDTSTYKVDGDPVGIDISKADGKAPAKRFTPLAAVYSDSKRIVFYVDKENYLRDAYYDDGSWEEGTLYNKQWKCAAYSKLAAIRLTNGLGYDFICLYYQDISDTGDIKLVSYSDQNGWEEGNPPLDDPPLYGTNLSVVPPEPGIEVETDNGKDTKDPVIFFQYDKLELGSSQDQGDDDYATYYITDKKKILSAHAALAAVDDGTNFWCFYTSDKSEVQRLRIDANGTITQPQLVPLEVTPIPASSLSTVLVKSSVDKIVLFYLLHYESQKKTAQEINVFATTLTAKSDAPDTWDVSGRVCLT